ncbi:chloramphenicol acetyltransferase [Roseateles sp. DAIF2]|uniref:CatA-like O-acetyltransferase n=1 Tax=Roseateles sp. DAIF2 TaxID=2714952 RepID=UPI0018A26F42|nr:CatA-like O-acetyltransferase [Roseateles sp. DAIF2]QPF73875.1 chloramphenicol acetyltransferase [Roseateles sp. DAIF2]
MTMSAAKQLRLEGWPRRAAFEHFRGLAQPFFSLCATVDVGALAARVRACPGATPFLVYHHAALRAANVVEPFRYRLDGAGVRVHARVNGSTTVLREDGESLGFADLPYEPKLADFVARALPVLAAARRPAPGLGAEGAALDEQAPLIHMTTIPWLFFSSFSHARGAGDDVPKLAFGRIVEQQGQRLMPVGVEVHHALMDGLHVGRFYAAMQAALDGEEA